MVAGVWGGGSGGGGGSRVGAELSAARGSNFPTQSDTGDGANTRLDFTTRRLALRLYK